MTNAGGSHLQTGGRRTRSAGSGSFIIDEMGTLLGFDQGMEDLTGWPAVEVVGRAGPLVREAGGVEGGFRALMAAPGEAASGAGEGSARIEIRLGCRDGRSVDVEAQVARLPGSGRRVIVTVLRVLTLSGSPESRIVVGRRDDMTGLADRASFETLLAETIRETARDARPLALVLLDVDHLRRINDRFGRRAGDEVILKLAGILRASVEDEHGVARLGDDDFAVLLRDAGRGEARQFAARLRSTVERFRFLPAVHHDGPAPIITLSLGAASFPADADSGFDLLARAREALDEARALGRNRVWCYLRRPRVPLRAPIYFDGPKPLLVGFTRDLSPSGVFVETPVPIEIGMRCALSFPLPTADGNVHVIGRVVRKVPAAASMTVGESRAPGMGVEFERFGPEDRRAIDGFLHQNEATSLRPETGVLSF